MTGYSYVGELRVANTPVEKEQGKTGVREPLLVLWDSVERQFRHLCGGGNLQKQTVLPPGPRPKATDSHSLSSHSRRNGRQEGRYK